LKAREAFLKPSPDRYPIARERITKSFGSLNAFSKVSGIPKASIVRVLNGTYGQDDSRQRERIERAMKARGVEAKDLRNLWAEIQEQIDTRTIQIGPARIRISTVVVVEALEEA
jgi:hypothetical protein